MQGTLDTIIGEHQSGAIKNRIILQTLFIICDIIDASNKLNKYLFVISLELILSFLLFIRSNDDEDMIHMIKVDSHDTPI